MATKVFAQGNNLPQIPVADATNRALDGILGFLAVISVLLAVGIFMLLRRAGNAQAIPAQAVSTQIIPPRTIPGVTVLAELPDNSPLDISTEGWKQRALVAEAMMGKQGEILREKMIPELTEFAKQSLVQGLYAQRNLLIETQLKAQEALAELEWRLKTVQAPLQERIRAYEVRIAELEKEIQTQNEEMRELTHATLTLIRQKLEVERQNVPPQSRFN
jgi:hypothetical protein